MDGSFGPQTVDVVKRIQKAIGAKPDGVTHEDTMFMLQMGGFTTFHCR